MPETSPVLRKQLANLRHTSGRSRIRMAERAFWLVLSRLEAWRPTTHEFQRRSGSDHLTPPALLVQTADAVVEQGMAALRARKSPTIIAGTWLQKLITFANRFRSRRGIVKQMGDMFRDPPTG